MDFVSSITMFICAEWTDNLHELHISSSEQMLPYVAAADYGAYTVAIRKYLQVIKNSVPFSYLGFLSHLFTNYRTADEEGGHFLNSSLPLPPVSQTLRH